MKITVDDTEEKLLITHLVDGDHRAFRAIYDRHSKSLFKRLIRLTRIEQVAEDLLQETFVKLWEKRDSIDPSLPVKPWLYKVAENLVFQFYRDLSRDSRLQQQMISWYVQDDTIAFEEALFSSERQELLQKAIQQLSPMRKKVFNMCKMQGHSYEEAARQLGISTSTVSNHLLKANATVRLYLAQYKDSLFVLLSFFLSDTKL